MPVVALVANLLMTQASLPPHAPDYAQASAWICRPDRQNACAIDLATVGGLAPQGSATSPPLKPVPSIDCFYVYPTISTAEGDNAPIEVGEDERRVVALQLARFRSVCRLYAPLYRQLTVSDMKRRLEGGTTPDLAKAMAMAEADVTAAWAYYLEHDNQGRGLVFIGHSQGALILQNLIRDQIDAKPLQARFVAAILPGSFVTAPRGSNVGGTFSAIPACRTQGQIGCVIAFNSFLDAAGPPPAYKAADDPRRRSGNHYSVVLSCHGAASRPPRPLCRDSQPLRTVPRRRRRSLSVDHRPRRLFGRVWRLRIRGRAGCRHGPSSD